MSGRILVIDWRQHGVFGAVLYTGRKEHRVIASVHVPLELDPDDMDAAPLQRVLKAIADQTALSDIACSIVLPTAWFQFHRIHLPFRRRSDIESVLPFEVAPHLIGTVDEMALSFETIQEDASGAWVLAAAIPKTRIQDIVAATQAYRLKIQHILPASVMLARVIAERQSDPSKPDFLFLLFEGVEDVSFVGVSRDRMRFVRCLSLASASGDPHEEERCRWLASEIRRTLLSENEPEEERFAPVAAVVLSEADPASWQENGVSGDVGVPVQPLVSVARLDLPEGMAFDHWLWCRMHEMVPGEGMDFFPGTQNLRSLWSAHRNRIVWTALLVGFTLVLVFGSIGLDIWFATRKVRVMDRAISARFYQVFPPEVPLVDPVEQVRVHNRQLAEDPLMAFSAAPTKTVDVLDALVREVIGNLDLILTRLSLEPEKLSIGGHSADFESVYEVKRRLERPGSQTTVTIQSAAHDTALNRVVFSMDIARFRP